MQYSAGSVAVTNGSPNVVGTGTLWTDYLVPGSLFTVRSSGVTYTVASVTDDTHITLTANYAGPTASGQLYACSMSFTPEYEIPYPEPGDIETASIVKAAIAKIEDLIFGVAGDGIVQFSEMQNISQYQILGRTAVGSGPISALTLASDVWGILNSANNAAIITSLGLGSLATLSAVGAAQITDGSVGNAEIRNSAGLSVIGRSANTTGAVADITGTDGQVLRVSGTVLGFGTLAAGAFANNTIVPARLSVNTGKIVGRYSASQGAGEELTPSAPIAIDGSGNLWLNVNGLTDDTAPSMANDFLLEYDTSASGLKKVSPKRIGAGREAIWLPAAAWLRATTSPPAALAQLETTTNKINLEYLGFDPTAIEYVSLLLPWAKRYGTTTVTFKAWWMHPSTTTNFGTTWGLWARGYSDAEDSDAAYSATVTVVDTGGVTNRVYQTPESSALTVDSLASEDLVSLRFARVATNGSDNLAVDANLIGVMLYLTSAQNTDD